MPCDRSSSGKCFDCKYRPRTVYRVCCITNGCHIPMLTTSDYHHARREFFRYAFFAPGSYAIEEVMHDD